MEGMWRVAWESQHSSVVHCVERGGVGVVGGVRRVRVRKRVRKRVRRVEWVNILFVQTESKDQPS